MKESALRGGAAVVVRNAAKAGGGGELAEDGAGFEAPIVLEDVTYALGRKVILDHVSLAVRRGETYVVMGLSGSGKTTLLRVIIGLAKASGGSILLFGQPTMGASEQTMSRLRRHMGMVFQYSALFDSLTVGENVEFALREHTRLPREERRRVVGEKLGLVGLPGTEGMFPEQLSGGMKKRVGVARALALDPEVMLYDEPTSGLDSLSAATINGLIMELKEALGVTSVIVTHDVEVVRETADRVAVLHEGRILADGSVEEVCQSEDALVRQLVHCHPEGPLGAR